MYTYVYDTHVALALYVSCICNAIYQIHIIFFIF